MKSIFGIFLVLLGGTWATHYRFCAPNDITEEICSSLQRGESQIICERVTDSADCALKLDKGDAHFGIFNAEELLLAYQFYPNEIRPITQLRHKDRTKQNFDFQTVVVVPDSYNPNEGLRGLQNGGLCHPGFIKSQKWNDNILKFFERKAVNHECLVNASVGENEAINLKKFFGKACRPGEWVKDEGEDKELKKKYPELCDLCDIPDSCSYYNDNSNAHDGELGALNCLKSGRGKAAYASYETVRQFFGVNLTGPEPRVAQGGFQFLRPNGALEPLTSPEPNAWISQPWPVIAAKDTISSELSDRLKEWLHPTNNLPWTAIFRKIIETTGQVSLLPDQTTLRSYLTTGREVDIPKERCGKPIGWCTISPEEKNKCEWVAKESLLLSIQPEFICVEKNSTFECLRAISEMEADIIVIDSHYGHLARTMYNLTPVLYVEPDKNKNSAVVAVIKDSSSPEFTSLSSLKNRNACFPEYGGIAWLSLINTVKNNGVISNTCYYATALADLFSGACTPGINDRNHSKIAEKSEIVDKLCATCAGNINLTCSANSDNLYYGDHGVLNCLDDRGDVGFIEARNIGGRIRNRFLELSSYRVLCKNGSLALNTGFDVDENCALSITIDSEVVNRLNTSRIDTLDITTALLKLEEWLGYSGHGSRTIRIYESFKGSSNLLFKDTTVGLEPKNSDIHTVVAYKELIDNVELCKDSGAASMFNSISIICLLIFINLFN